MNDNREILIRQINWCSFCLFQESDVADFDTDNRPKK